MNENKALFSRIGESLELRTNFIKREKRRVFKNVILRQMSVFCRIKTKY